MEIFYVDILFYHLIYYQKLHGSDDFLQLDGFSGGPNLQEPKTSIVTPNTIITFRFCCKWVLGILQKKLNMYYKDFVHIACFIFVKA